MAETSHCLYVKNCLLLYEMVVSFGVVNTLHLNLLFFLKSVPLTLFQSDFTIMISLFKSQFNYNIIEYRTKLNKSTIIINIIIILWI